MALMALVGIGAWACAPLAAAHPQTAAAQMARALAGSPLEAAVTDALAAVADESGADTQAFAEALYAALEAQPESDSLQELLKHHSPESLLELLLGQLMHSYPAPHPVLASAAVAQVASSGVGNAGSALYEVPVGIQALRTASSTVTASVDETVSIWKLSSAQPLGP